MGDKLSLFVSHQIRHILTNGNKETIAVSRYTAPNRYTTAAKIDYGMHLVDTKRQSTEEVRDGP